MSATSQPRAPRRARTAQAGVFAVEFALVAVLFFSVIFSVMELARFLYLWNTLQEVTRRAASAAAATDFSNPAAKDLVRQRAIFRASAGTLSLGEPITDQHIRIDYMALVPGPGGSTMTAIAALPGCPARNRLKCTANPNDASCIRFVRVRVCDPGDTSVCNAVHYQSLVSLINLPIDLPRSTTIVKAESLGYTPGMPLCP